jgi:hypothetical protein
MSDKDKKAVEQISRRNKMNINEIESGEIDCEWRQGFKEKLTNGTFSKEDIDFLVDCLFDSKETNESYQRKIVVLIEALERISTNWSPNPRLEAEEALKEYRGEA